MTVLAERGRSREVTPVRRGLSAAGLAVGAVGFSLSLTPSLLPRGWVFQGVVTGVAAICGYGVGAGLSALARAAGWEPFRTDARRLARWVVFACGVALALVFVFLGHRWQRDQRTLLGMPSLTPWNPLGILLIACLVFVVLLLLSRLVRLCSRKVSAVLARYVPAPVALIGGITFGIFFVAGFIQGFLFNGVIDALNKTSSITNGKVPAGISRPTSPLVSGGPGSRSPWQTLGFEGRFFVASATPQARISAFTGQPARQPIRVYTGLGSARSPQERSQLALAELDRTGAFSRSVLAIVTTTGSGWVDQRAAAALEYLHGGDTAIVATQYSYLPSWLSFLVDRSKAASAASSLTSAVRTNLDALPAKSRPRLLLYGESLGSYGIEEAAGNETGLLSAADGALLVGPPFANRLHSRFTEARDPGSPVWLPTYRQGRSIRFARIPADLAAAPPHRRQPRVVYLQNATDPIVWWSPTLLFSAPPWLDHPRGPDLPSGMRWFPIVTFWQATVDLLAANGVPFGHGHRYGPNLVDALTSLGTPPTWTNAHTEKLRDLVANLSGAQK